MEILEIVSGAQINGAVVHCAQLSRELARRGHGVTVVCRHGAKIEGLLADAPVRIVESDLHRLPFDELRRIGAIAREAGIDVIHTHMTRAHNFGVALRRFAGIPCVATAHSHIIQPLTWVFNDHVIAVSDATRRFQQSRNLVRPSRIETVHGFMDYERQSAVRSGARAAVRAELGLLDETPVFGIIGDIIPRKGHEHVIQALAQIVSDIPEVRMLVVGDPKRSMGQRYFERVRELAARLGVDKQIVWAGYRTDVLDVLTAIDVYVLASLDEMFPVAVLEAMAASRPIVATRVGGVPECLEDEITALLVPPADPAALGGAIRRLLTDRDFAAELGRRAHVTARDRFSVESQAPRVEAVFERVVARCRSRGGSKPGQGAAA
jgi:glycosyltransferase involved in cell wall biosynthesis